MPRRREAREWQPIAPTLADLAAVFGVSEHAVEKWRRKGMPVVRNKSGRAQGYDLREITPWWAEHVFSSPKHQAHHGRSSETKDAIELEKLAMLRLDRQKKQGELMPRQFALDILDTVAGIYRQSAEQLGRQSTWTGSEAQGVILEAIEEVQMELERRFGDDESGN